MGFIEDIIAEKQRMASEFYRLQDEAVHNLDLEASIMPIIELFNIDRTVHVDAFIAAYADKWRDEPLSEKERRVLLVGWIKDEQEAMGERLKAEVDAFNRPKI